MSKVIESHYGEPAEKSFNLRTALQEAGRCLLCFDAPCSQDCPAGTDPGKFIRSLRFRNIKGAAATIRENNPLGGSCALVCPYDKLCEKGCSRSGIDVPIAIGKLQHFRVEQEQAFNMRVLTPGPANHKKVLCLGAGPASLACAATLARLGCRVSVLEAKQKAGGVLSYGISPSRLPQAVVDYDIGLIKDLGVSFEFNRRVEAAQLADLAKQYDAVFVGVGLWQSKALDVPGLELAGVWRALDYLQQARVHRAKEEASHVLVIGGGDVAMDCASSAKQLGAEHTKIVYRRGIAEAPANREELSFVRGLGIPIITEFAPAEILGSNGKVVGMKFKGRDGYSKLTLKADKVIFAIGQERTKDMAELALADNVFTGGDYTNGGQTVVQAVAEGKQAAQKIMAYLLPGPTA